MLFLETETAKQNQKIPFHFFFRFAAEGWGEETREKCKEIFLAFAHASPRACPRRIGSLHQAIGAYDLGQSHHALRACESVKILRIFPEIHSNFVQYTPHIIK